jgi:hypothetical protein
MSYATLLRSATLALAVMTFSSAIVTARAETLEEPFPLNARYLTIQCSHPDRGGSGGLSCSETYGKADKWRTEYSSLGECERIRDRMN